MITKNKLDELVKKYETADFISPDPISIPHNFKTKKDIEIAGFIASLVAYGSRKVFLKKLDELFKIAQNEPLNFILNFESKILGDFNYRFGKPADFAEIFKIMRTLYEKDGGLEELFKYGYTNLDNPSPFGRGSQCNRASAMDTLTGEGSPNELEQKSYENISSVVRMQKMFSVVTDYFYSRVDKNIGQGFYFMIPDPRKGGAMKRMCMYLRWMVRKPPVDFGIWNFMPAAELLIPLDVHVARVSREMGLLTRKQNDFKAVIELTENLKKFDPQDPSKYDFAIFGLGVDDVHS